MVEVNRSGFFLLMFMMFMLFMPAGNPPRLMSDAERRNLRGYLERSVYEVEVVANSTWTSGLGNLTGIKEYPGPEGVKGSILPKKLYHKVHDLWSGESDDRDRAYFSNVSANLHGEWERLDDLGVEPVLMPVPGKNTTQERVTLVTPLGNEITLEALPKPGNVSALKGNIQVSFEDEQRSSAANLSVVSAIVTVTDDEDNDAHSLRLEGIHIKESGNVLLSTSSLKFSGLHAIPHLILSQEYFDEARDAVVKELNTSLSAKLQDPYYGIYEEAAAAAERCEFVFYGHLRSTHLSREELDAIEDELSHPQGRPHSHVPPVTMDGVLYSPDCGLVLSTQKASGDRNEEYYKRIRLTMMGAIALVLCQTIMTAYQMKDTSTPSTISRVSMYSVALMAMLDGAVFMTAFVCSLLEEVAYPFLAVTFLACTLVSLFEIPYMDLIYRSQRYEVVADARAREARGAGSDAVQFVARPDGSIGPAAATATEGDDSQNRASPSPNLTTIMDQDERQVSSMIYSRYFFLLFSFLFLTAMSSSWPASIRHAYEYTVLLVLYSYWVPQIYRNVRRGSRRAFLLSFVLTISGVRLVPVLYACLVPNNIANHRLDPTLAAVISGWQWVQVLVLVAQSILGPRFFLPRGYLPDLYDYHPIITEEDIESGFAFDNDPDSNLPKLKSDGTGTGVSGRTASETSSPSQSDSESPLLSRKDSDHAHSNKVDCAICMNDIELVIVPRNNASLASTPANVLARRRYMVTPCRHVFHTECMEQWMRTRLQCPVCRNPLPPI